MRDLKRIEKTLKKIGECWNLVPDWRFGQLLVNVFFKDEERLFNIEDDDLLNELEKFFED